MQEICPHRGGGGGGGGGELNSKQGITARQYDISLKTGNRICLFIVFIIIMKVCSLTSVHG